MFTRKPWPISMLTDMWLPILMTLAMILFLMSTLTGCQANRSGGSSPPSTPTLIARAQEESQAAHQILVVGENSVLKLIEAINADNVAVQVPLAKARVLEADGHVQQAAGATESASKQAEKDVKKIEGLAKENTKLKQADPMRNRFNFWGFTLTFLSISVFVATFFLGSFLPAFISLKEVRTGCIIGSAVGLTMITIAWFLVEIRIAFIILLGVGALGGLAWAILYAIKNRNRAANIIKSLEAGKDAGLTITPAAAAAINKVQTVDVRAFVDSLQDASPTPAPSAT